MGCSNSSMVDVGLTPGEASSQSKGRGARGGSGFRLPAALPRECVGQKIGSGSFGTVYAVVGADKIFINSEIAKRPLAAKVITFGSRPESACTRMEKAFREARVWQHICTKHCEEVVSLVETFMDGFRVVYVMERCNMALTEHIAMMPVLNEYQVALMLRQMLHGLHHVHSLNVIHRDVKPDNFLVSNGIIKLSDFGLAVLSDDIWEAGNEPTQLRPHPKPMVAGTAPFMSPEMLSNVRYTAKTDIWSLGCLAYLLIFGQFPYMPKEMNGDSMKDAIRSDTCGPDFRPGSDRKFPKLPKGSYKGASEEAKNFLVITLTRDPYKRPTAGDSLGLSFLTQTPNTQEQEALPSLHNMYRRACLCGGFEHVRRPPPVRVPVKKIYDEGELQSPGVTTASTAASSTD